MRAIHNGRDPHLQVERYFKAGRWGSLVSRRSQGAGQLTTLDLFGINESEISIPARVDSSPENPTDSSPDNSTEISEIAPVLGIDLEKRSDEVKKLLFAGFGRRIVAMGYDPEDVLQDVYKGLLARNMGKCPWDARKSSFGHYVHMVCGCIVSNYHRKYNRINQNERTGVFAMRDGGSCEVDLAESNLCVDRERQGDRIEEEEMIFELESAIRRSPADEALEDGIYSKRSVSLDVLPLLVRGWKRREIAQELGIREGIITKSINLIRKTAMELWNVAPRW